MDEESTYEQEAGDNVGNWLRQAIQNLDAEFGDGYAKSHPELMQTMIIASTIDANATCLLNILNELLPETYTEEGEEDAE